MSDTQAPPTEKKSHRTTLVAVLVTALAAAGGGFWWSRVAGADQAGAAAPAEKAAASRALLKFDPFVVNLADGVGTRFLRATLQLVVEPAEAAEQIAAHPVTMLELRSALLELLAEQSAAALVTAEGKAAVKAAIITRAQAALQTGTVTDVLFAEFVVQF